MDFIAERCPHCEGGELAVVQSEEAYTWSRALSRLSAKRLTRHFKRRI
jgi:hypothetical protein